MSHLPADAHREDFSEVIEQIYKILGNRSIPEELENLKTQPRKFRKKFSKICAENNGEILRDFMRAKGAGRRTCHGLVDGVFVFERWCADLGITNIDAVEIYKGEHSHKLLQAFHQLVSFVPPESSEVHIRGCACLDCRWSSMLDHYITTNSILPTSTIQRLVSKGVPEGIREEVWFWLSGGSSVALERNPHYKDLLDQDGGFGELIDLDVSRTFCEEKNWQKKGGAKILKRLLRAYSVRNPMVGYCQGMSYVAALLIDCCSEEVAFCCLCALIEDGPMPPDYYTSLKGAVVDRLVLEELAEQYLKGLCGALENEQRSLSEFSFLTIPWYLCLFTATLPVDVSTRIWDFYLANGMCVIFRVSLGILMVAQGPIVSGEDSLNDLRDLIEKSINELGVCDVPDYCTAFNKVTNTVIDVMRESKRKEIEKEEEVDRKFGRKTDNMDRCFLTVKDSPEPTEKVDDDYFQVEKRRADSGGSSGRRGERLMQELGDFMMATFPAGRRRRKGERRLQNICVDDFDILNEVGKGTYGQVFKAIDKRTQQYVALKRVLLKNEKEGFPVTAVREIKILKRLQHENVVRMLDVVFAKPTENNKHRGSVYMVFEYMDHDLSGVLAYRSQRGDTGVATGNLRPDEVKCIFLQVLRGLDYCHKHNVVHRDLKLSNLLLDKLGHIKIADFGLARIYKEGRLNQTNRVITRWYRPPELLLGTTIYDSKVDTWSAGCILAELMRGKALFPGESETEVYRMISDTLGAPCEDMWPECTRLPNYAQLNEAYQHMRKLWGSSSTSSAVRQTGIGLGGGSSASTGRLPASMVEGDEGRFYQDRQTFRYVFSNTTDSGRDLLARLLQCDPARRLNTAGALNHGYFSERPLACSAHSLRLSSSRSCHEATTTNVAGQGRLGAITGAASLYRPREGTASSQQQLPQAKRARLPNG